MNDLKIWNKRMLELMNYCVANNINGITSASGWLTSLGILKTNGDKLKKGQLGFNHDQIHLAGTLYGASMEYIYGFSDQMFREKVSTVDVLREALRLAEQDVRAEKSKPKVKQKLKQKA